MFDYLNRRLSLVWKIVLGNLAITVLTAAAARDLTSRSVVPEWVAWLVFFAILAVVDYFIVRAATVPLRLLTRLAGEVALHGSSARAPSDYADPDVRQVAAVINSLLYTLEEQRSDFTRRIFTAQEVERREVAQRLHDGPVQTLAVQQMELGLLERRELDSLTAQEMRDVAELGQSAIDALRAVIRDVRPTALDELGLIPAISAFLDERLGPLGIGHQLEVTEGTPGRLPAMTEATIFRTAQEAIHNVIRHARASEVLVRLHLGRREAVLLVEDNGVGITQEDLAAPGLGILGMRERASLIGGTLQIGRRKEGGTRLRLAIASIEGAGDKAGGG